MEDTAVLQFRIIVVVTNYFDISRIMDYNRNLQIWTIYRNYNTVYVQHNTNGKLAVYGGTALVAYRKGLGPTAAAQFLVYTFYF